MLSKTSQTKKDKYCMVSLYMEFFKKPDLIDIRNGMVFARDWGEREMGGCRSEGTNFQL